MAKTAIITINFQDQNSLHACIPEVFLVETFLTLLKNPRNLFFVRVVLQIHIGLKNVWRLHFEGMVKSWSEKSSFCKHFCVDSEMAFAFKRFDWTLCIILFSDWFRLNWKPMKNHHVAGFPPWIERKMLWREFEVIIPIKKMPIENGKIPVPMMNLKGIQCKRLSVLSSPSH